MYAGRAGAEERAFPPATSIISLPLPLPVPLEGGAKFLLYSHSDVLSTFYVLSTVLGAGSTATNYTRPRFHRAYTPRAGRQQACPQIGKYFQKVDRGLKKREND